MEISDVTQPLKVSNANLAQSSFDDVDLSLSVFRNARLQRVRLTDVDLERSVVRNANLSRVEIDDCNLAGMRINGVLVEDLLAAYARQRRA
jgi:uncharacterized protein YjbI with pentapeptide repeats